MRDDELFDQLLAGELPAAELRALREALARRVEELQQARERGEVLPDDLDLDALAEGLRALREEELVSEFVEQGMATMLRRWAILREIGEADDAAPD